MIIKNLYTFILAFIVGCAITGCSKEDDNEYRGDSAIGNMDMVFPNGLVKSIAYTYFDGELNTSISNIVRDEKGRVISITLNDKYKEECEIEYTSNNTVSVTVSYNADNEMGYFGTYIFTLGANGFIKSGNGPFVKYYMGYDAQGHLTSIRTTEDWIESYYESTQTFRYNNEGDIIKLEYRSKNIDYYNKRYTLDPYWTGTSDIGYTSTTASEPIENKGGIMMFAHRNMSDVGKCLYYAGLLGKATTHLPVRVKSTDKWYYSIDGDTTYTSNEAWTWIIDNQGLPKSMWCSRIGDYESEGYYFTW